MRRTILALMTALAVMTAMTAALDDDRWRAEALLDTAMDACIENCWPWFGKDAFYVIPEENLEP